MFGNGLDRFADLGELGVILGLLAGQQAFYGAEQLGADAGFYFEFFELQFGFDGLGEH
ncbi:hypothetical protein D3C87_1964800 [compost metagenome]